jgi:hypothetical protein
MLGACMLGPPMPPVMTRHVVHAGCLHALGERRTAADRVRAGRAARTCRATGSARSAAPRRLLRLPQNEKSTVSLG